MNAGGNGSSELDEHRLEWGKPDVPYELFFQSISDIILPVASVSAPSHSGATHGAKNWTEPKSIESVAAYTEVLLQKTSSTPFSLIY